MKHLLSALFVIFITACSGEQSIQEVATSKTSINMNETIGEKNKERVRRFFQLLEEENIPAFINLFAEDGKQVNPYASGLFPAGAEGREALSAYWTPVPGHFDSMKFPIHEIYAMEDPSCVFVSYSGKIKLKDNTGYYENEYYSLFRFDDKGKIKEYIEIFNPIVAARGFGLLNQITAS